MRLSGQNSVLPYSTHTHQNVVSRYLGTVFYPYGILEADLCPHTRLKRSHSLAFVYQESSILGTAKGVLCVPSSPFLVPCREQKTLVTIPECRAESGSNIQCQEQHRSAAGRVRREAMLPGAGKKQSQYRLMPVPVPLRGWRITIKRSDVEQRTLDRRCCGITPQEAFSSKEHSRINAAKDRSEVSSNIWIFFSKMLLSRILVKLSSPRFF